MEQISIGIGSFLLGAFGAGLYLYRRLSIAVVDSETWKTKYELTQTSIEQSKKETSALQNTLSLQFKDLAQKIFDEKISKLDQSSTKNTDQNLKQIESLLNPLKEKLKDFEKKVEESYSAERMERHNLKSEITKLVDLNLTMSREAQNLTQALKGDNKMQGNWGELILENILERSGLRKGEEYFTQETVKDGEGIYRRPDVIVKLPDGKHLIVDSKVTLLAYEASMSADNEADRLRFAQAHVESLKEHVNGLAGRKYHLSENIISPDFVMLFMPLEPAFAMAFKLKPELFESAWDKNVAIVSPTTLLATLRTVASLWKQERQQQNALEIAKKGGDMYDKFAGMVAELDKLGNQLATAQKTHNEVMIKLSTGRGNLISQAQKMKELGAKADKSLPQALIEE
ncbi:MAG: recombination protein rmuC [Pseudobdellovibrio sp.]|jgi:DNA recombination protein RmuC|nr:recombination protein rmuC [Pseudobdellovibrio sp.]